MDTTTLVVANGALFALYAGVMLVNARMVGGARGAMWFAGSSLLRAASMLVVGVGWWQMMPVRYAGAISATLAVLGALMLHHAFTELLEHHEVMRWAQYVLVAVMICCCVLMATRQPWQRYMGVMLCVALCLQFAIVALVVFRFSGEGVGPVGWLTGTALSVYSLTLLLRGVAASSLGQSWGWLQLWVMPLWLYSCLVTSAATAFGFKSLSTARLREELLWRAQVDELTGLLNRWALKRLVMREIAQSRRSGAPLTMLMIDLDGLKRINDTRGHACGDVVLQACAGLLQEMVRPQDAVARMGGDEFCVLLPATRLEAALAIAERLRQEIAGLAILYRGATVGSAASVGLASSEHCGLAWQMLVDASDSALYRAKREGKNRVVVACETDLLGVMAKEAGSQLLREQGGLVQ